MGRAYKRGALPWIGLGPGNYGSGAGYITNAPGFSLIRDVFGQFETNRETALNSQFLATLGEFGILGILLFFVVILALAGRTWIVKQAEGDATTRAVLAAMLVGQLSFWSRRLLSTLGKGSRSPTRFGCAVHS